MFTSRKIGNIDRKIIFNSILKKYLPNIYQDNTLF